MHCGPVLFRSVIRWFLADHKPAIDADHLSGDPVICRVQQMDHGSGDIVGHTAPPKRDHLGFLLFHGGLLLGGQQHAFAQERGFNRARCDCIDANVSRGQLKRPAARQMFDGGFAGPVKAKMCACLAAKRARQIDNRPLALHQIWQ